MRKIFMSLITLAGLLLFSQISSSQTPVLKIKNGEDVNVYLQRIVIDVKIAGSIATTTMNLVFHNKTAKVLEGELVFPLPENATVTGYGLDINGKMRDAVAVEKIKATTAFESIERRKVDPGLLEKVEGNNFRTRIYPVPASGTREVKISYAQELIINRGNAVSYHLPLHFKRAVDKFRLDVAVIKSTLKPLVRDQPAELNFSSWNNTYTASIQKNNFAATRSLTIDIPVLTDIPAVMMQKKGQSFYFLVNTFPAYKPQRRSLPGEITIIWDASLSGLDRNRAIELEFLGKYFREIKNVDVKLAYLSNSFRKDKKFRVRNGIWTMLRKAIESIVYDGGTNFSSIDLNDVPADEYLLFSDGLSTFGEVEFALNGKPVHTINSSPSTDHQGLKWLAQRSGGRYVNLDQTKTTEAIQYLLEEPFQFIGLKQDKNTTEVYPSVATPATTSFSLAGVAIAPNAVITLQFGYGKKVVLEKTITLDPARFLVDSTIDIARHWAQKKINELDIQYEKHKDIISALGKRFSIVTRNTSLIVLETVNDYVQYEIEPPVELRAEYEKLLKQRRRNIQDDEESLFSETLTAMNDLRQWWNKEHVIGVRDLKDSRNVRAPVPNEEAVSPDTTAIARDAEISEPVNNAVVISDTASHLLQEVVVVGYATTRKRSLTASVTTVEGESLTTILQGRVPGISVAGASPSIALRGMATSAQSGSDEKKEPGILIHEWKPYRTYLDKIKKTKRENQYLKYLELRKEYLHTPSFYYDMAGFFFHQKDSVTGMKILSNIAELQFEDHELYKLLGFTLKQLGAYEEAIYIFGKVLKWRPQEPQSYRDYGLALADAGKYQHALDTLYTAITKKYTTDIKDMFSGIEETFATEISHLISIHKDQLDLSMIDTTLLQSMPVDIRVVLNWNSKDTDIDLWVTDPNGEKSYYSHKASSGGGRLSEDQTEGYGPEQFLLKKATSGRYRVEVDYYRDSQLTLSGPTTLMVEIYTHYGGNGQQRKVLTLQMSDEEEKDGILVGEFDF